jgi:hypothetical protein
MANASSIDEALEVMAQLFLETRPTPVTAVAIGGESPKDENLVVFIDCGASACEEEGILSEASEAAEPFMVSIRRCSRFEGLQVAGESIAPFDIHVYNIPPVTVGTFGAAVKAGGVWYAISSNHVLGNNGRTPAGCGVFTPGPVDAVGGGTEIARYTDCVLLIPPEWPLRGSNPNRFDCARAELMQAPASPVEVTPVSGSIGMDVAKIGRTTGKTQSTIAYRQFCVVVDFKFGSFYFKEQLATFDPPAGQASGRYPWFAMPGDSGSLVTDDPDTTKGIGLVCARGYVYNRANEFEGYLILISPFMVSGGTQGNQLEKYLGAGANLYSI